jgi:hypothetical protein
MLTPLKLVAGAIVAAGAGVPGVADAGSTCGAADPAATTCRVAAFTVTGNTRAGSPSQAWSSVTRSAGIPW